MYIIFMRANQDPFNNAIDSIMGMVVMSLGQFGDYYDLFGRTRFTNFAKVWTMFN